MNIFPVFFRDSRKVHFSGKNDPIPLWFLEKGDPKIPISRKSGHFFPLFCQLGRRFSTFFFFGNVHFSGTNRATQTWPAHRNFFNPRTARGHWSSGSLKKWSIGALGETPHFLCGASFFKKTGVFSLLRTFACLERYFPDLRQIWTRSWQIRSFGDPDPDLSQIWTRSGSPQDPVLGDPKSGPDPGRSVKIAPLCASQIIFGKMSPLEMLFRFIRRRLCSEPIIQTQHFTIFFYPYTLSK